MILPLSKHFRLHGRLGHSLISAIWRRYRKLSIERWALGALLGSRGSSLAPAELAFGCRHLGLGPVRVERQREDVFGCLRAAVDLAALHQFGRVYPLAERGNHKRPLRPLAVQALLRLDHCR